MAASAARSRLPWRSARQTRTAAPPARPAVPRPVCDFGWRAPAFRLPATDGRMVSLGDIARPRGTVIAFLSNSCPYVLAILDRLVRDARDLAEIGIGVAAICSNDSDAAPEDTPRRMADLARERGFAFPYLHDAGQEIARAWGVTCTPEFFGFGSGLRLQYHGRIDASGRLPAAPGARRELYEAMALIAATGEGPRDQRPAQGSPIRWRPA